MGKKRETICLLIPRYQNMFSSFYTLEVIKEVSRAAIDLDVDLLVETGWNVSVGSGILFADIIDNAKWIKKAKREKIPYLILNYYNPVSKENCVGIDNEKASFEAVNYLVLVGHRNIGCITGKLNSQTGKERLNGFKRACKINNIKADKKFIMAGDWTKESGSLAMKKMLSLNKKNFPTAVFVAGDEMALGAMEVVKEVGLKIPEDISFIGFDNIPQSGLKEVSLSTIEQPFSDLATLGVKHLIDIIKEKTKQPVKILLDNTKFIKRASVRALVSN